MAEEIIQTWFLSAAVVGFVMIETRIGTEIEAEMTGIATEDVMTGTETETGAGMTRIATEIETGAVTERMTGRKTGAATGIRKGVKISIRIKRIKAGTVTEKTPTTRKRRRRRERNLKMNMRIMRMTGIPKNIKGTMMIMRRNQAARKVRSPMMGMMITTENQVPRNTRKVTKPARTTLTVKGTKRRKRRRKIRTRIRRRGDGRGGVRRRRARYPGTGASGMTRQTPTGAGRRDTEPHHNKT